LIHDGVFSIEYVLREQLQIISGTVGISQQRCESSAGYDELFPSIVSISTRGSDVSRALSAVHAWNKVLPEKASERKGDGSNRYQELSGARDK
jgi:hypothetical protein